MMFDDKYDETLIMYAKKYNIPIKNKSLNMIKHDVYLYERKNKIQSCFMQHMMYYLRCDSILCHYEKKSY